MDDLSYYNFDAREATSFAKWISVIRLHCIYRTPACIYSNLLIPNRFPIRHRMSCIAVPEQVSNIISEMLERYRAREAALSPLDPTVRDVLVNAGVLYDGAWMVSDRQYAAHSLWRISMVSPLRFSDMLIESIEAVTRMDVRRQLIHAVSILDRSQAEPAPLFDNEVEWLSDNGYKWRSGVIDRGR